jgi:hypothetical protein
MRWVLGAAVLLAVGCGADEGDATTDAAAADALAPDALAPDAQPPDAQPPDAQAPDAAPPWSPPPVAYPGRDDARAFRLSETGLYRDFAARELAPDLVEFTPAFPLWSDGSRKTRWLRLPPGARIDTSAMDDWRLPVGATLFKEFRHPDGRRLETRVVARTGPGDRDYWFGAFVWDETETDAVFAREGAADVRGTAHDVPSVKQCGTCHNGEPGRALGLAAIQLATAEGGLERFAPLLSAPPAPGAVPGPPGDAVTVAALGYLHGNCAHCHNPAGSARPDTDMDLTLSVGDRAPEATAIFRTTVGVATQNFMDAEHPLRVVAGRSAESALLYRMTQRGPRTQMPPLASEVVHEEGVAAVRAWIDALP